MDNHKEIFIKHQSVPHGSSLLGRNQQQGASELQAGARAELMPSPLTRALSSPRGRLIYQTTKFLIKHDGFRNYIAVRIPLAKQIIQGAIPFQHTHPLIVELDVGFSPLSILLAQDLPNAKVIELDTAEVIQKRHERLQGAPIPQNLESIKADLTKISLLDALNGRKPDIIQFTGAYYTHDELLEILNYFQSILNVGGSLAIYLPWQPAQQEIRTAVRFFKRQIGNYPGMVKNEQEIHTLFSRSNFKSHTLIVPSKYAYQQKPLDVEVMVLAKN